MYKPKLFAGAVRTVIIAALLAALTAAPAVRAHLTGAFSTYLAAVYNEDTTLQLKEELEHTEAEIAAMTPRLEELEERYLADQAAAGDSLLEWTHAGLDIWASFTRSAMTITDALSNQWLVERALGRELERLDRLYRQYLQLGATQDALDGHRQLLEIIEANLAMREPYLASMGDIDLETQAYYLDIDWVAEVEDELMAALEADRLLAAEQWEQWLTVSELDGAFSFEQSWLNERSVLRYHFRPDHIYAVFDNDFANVIMTAQMIRNANDEYEFVIEGAFFNGFMLPEPALQELKGFSLSHALIGAATGASDGAYIEHAGGRLVWRTSNRIADGTAMSYLMKKEGLQDGRP